MSFDLIDAWRQSPETFIQQLNLNRQNLAKNTPAHIVDILREIHQYKSVTRVVDVGCGCGILYPILKEVYPHLEYVGYDYSEHAIALAKQTWGGNFECRDYRDLQPSDFSDSDILIANALLDVLPNADEALEHLLKLGFRYIILSRIRISSGPSRFEIVPAYDIKTYMYYHAPKVLLDLFNTYKYEYDMRLVYDDAYNCLLERYE